MKALFYVGEVSIFIPDGVSAPPRSVIRHPKLQVYINDFGKEKDDIGFVAVVDGNVVGAVWTRIMDDFGHIDNTTPSLAISIYKEYRGLGLGTEMMKKMLCELKQRGYSQTSLSLQKANDALKMYRRVGYEVVGENEEEYIMVCHLQSQAGSDHDC